jgi:hypothetical protein
LSSCSHCPACDVRPTPFTHYLLHFHIAEKLAKGYLETTAGAAPAAPAAKARQQQARLPRICPRRGDAEKVVGRLRGRAFTVAHGIDHGDYWTTANTRTKLFPNKTKVEKEHDRLVAEKVAEGYVEVSALRSKKLACAGNARTAGPPLLRIRKGDGEAVVGRRGGSRLRR